MPERYVIFGCNNVRSKEKGILLHPISFYGKSESEKQKGRRKWIDFVKSKRAHLEHTEHSAMCSEHFTEEDYTNRFADYLVRRLKRDEIGVCVFLSKHARCVSSHQAADKPESERSKRKVRYFSASVSLPVIFCSRLPRLRYFLANVITATRSLFEKRKDAMGSLVPVQGQYKC